MSPPKKNLNVEYKTKDDDINAEFRGIKLNHSYTRTLLANDTKKRYYDKYGTEEAIEKLQEISSTGFDEEDLTKVFELQIDPERDKIGECFAECYLKDRENIRFHHNSIRDEKNLKAQITGADILGFIDKDDDVIFLFGEVKTSADESSHPSVMYGEKGMRGQLDDLILKDNKRHELIRYIFFRVKELSEDNPFKKDFMKAFRAYMKKNKNLFHIIGILIKDTECNKSDLETHYEHLKKKLKDETGLQLLALYTPISLSNWKKIIEGGGGNGS